jgi:hypothetical protein
VGPGGQGLGRQGGLNAPHAPAWPAAHAAGFFLLRRPRPPSHPAGGRS